MSTQPLLSTDATATTQISPGEAVALADRIDREGFAGLSTYDITDTLRHMAYQVKNAPQFFSPGHDFEGDKLKWLQASKQ